MSNTEMEQDAALLDRFMGQGRPPLHLSIGIVSSPRLSEAPQLAGAFAAGFEVALAFAIRHPGIVPIIQARLSEETLAVADVTPERVRGNLDGTVARLLALFARNGALEVRQ